MLAGAITCSIGIWLNCHTTYTGTCYERLDCMSSVQVMRNQSMQLSKGLKGQETGIHLRPNQHPKRFWFHTVGRTSRFRITRGNLRVVRQHPQWFGENQECDSRKHGTPYWREISTKKDTDMRAPEVWYQRVIVLMVPIIRKINGALDTAGTIGAIDKGRSRSRLQIHWSPPLKSNCMLVATIGAIWSRWTVHWR